MSPMSLTPSDIVFPPELPKPPSSLSDKLLAELTKYVKYNGMLLGYIAILLTIRTLGKL